MYLENRIKSLILQKEVKAKPLFIKYMKTFFSECYSQDFSLYSDEDLLNLCSLNFDFLLQGFKGNFKLRLKNHLPKNKRINYTILDVISEDVPFLIDTIVIQFNKFGIGIKNIIHPIISIKKSITGKITDISSSEEKKSLSIIQIHLERIESSACIEDIEGRLNKILSLVHIVVSDWKLMVESIKQSKIDFGDKKNDKIIEINNFIDWIVDNHFVFLGSLEYNISKCGFKLEEVEDRRLGIFKFDYQDSRPDIISDIPVDYINSSISDPYFIEIVKSSYKSEIHRFVDAERIRVQKFDNKGNVIGEYIFLGLFTSSVYHQSVNTIPIIREKIKQAIANSGFRNNSHNFKDLISIVETYPRDELFQMNYDDLLRILRGIVAISGRSVVRFFARNDKFKRFVSCLVFIPKDNYNTSIKNRIHSILIESYGEEILNSYTYTSDSNLTRLYTIIKVDKDISAVNQAHIEERIVEISRSWFDDFRDGVRLLFDSDRANEVIDTYRDAFSVSYVSRFRPNNAIYDIEEIDKLFTGNHETICNIFKSSFVEEEEEVECKIYSTNKNLNLSNIMPILDSFGFNVVREHTYVILPNGHKKVFINYFRLNLDGNKKAVDKELRFNFEESINKIWINEFQVGYLNRLIVVASLTYRQVSILRAYLKYLDQVGFQYSQKYISNVLTKHKDIACLIVKLFEVKFDPALNKDRSKKVEETASAIELALEEVSDITDDIVIRRFYNVIDSTVRTNFFQKNIDGTPKDYISFKFNSSNVEGMPMPVPYAEIFVFSQTVEAIHLRGGKVSRGGLRWSDRPEDFRTEVLGLMKAQMTKNSVIVPVGSKGGFIVKRDISKISNEEALEEVKQCYKTFLRGMLDITDNVVNSKISYPSDVVRYDEDDPYLVVAADKGTATFSDVANKVSEEYNFWLGDAFASGGSAGYDHKKMGITARGAWVSVQRHFNEMGIDIQKEDFSCVGIGDLSGDVFGNGMLLSKHIKLVAAFNHLHIFLDPNPDVGKSYEERQRVFNLTKSSWMDYNKNLISKGGGIFSRKTKIIKISKEIRKVLSIEKDTLSPDELIKAILKSPVDLLWNGGIGTYVKSENESNQNVGDRINNPLRINGVNLRCKVVGEGGNLGFTQKGRIEYCLNGGKINSDFMDNSAGVDCSDHEVNIKIVLDQAIKEGKLSLKQRNSLLSSMTDKVASLVLTNNIVQSQVVTISYSKGYKALNDEARFLDRLERLGLLNREIEFLPTNKEIIKRQSDKKGMTRPELCVLLSYSKMDIYSKIINSKLLEDKYFDKILFNYFPTVIKDKFPDQISSHQLKLEIIATMVANFIVGKMGINFVDQIHRDKNFHIDEVVKSYIVAYESFKIDQLWQEVEDLYGKIDVKNSGRDVFIYQKTFRESYYVVTI